MSSKKKKPNKQKAKLPLLDFLKKQILFNNFK